jgi:hypothetical protein
MCIKLRRNVFLNPPLHFQKIFVGLCQPNILRMNSDFNSKFNNIAACEGQPSFYMRLISALGMFGDQAAFYFYQNAKHSKQLPHQFRSRFIPAT